MYDLAKKQQTFKMQEKTNFLFLFFLKQHSLWIWCFLAAAFFFLQTNKIKLLIDAKLEKNNSGLDFNWSKPLYLGVKLKS